MILFIIGLAQNALTGDNGLVDLLFLLCKAILERARIDSIPMEYYVGHASSHQVIDDHSGSLRSVRDWLADTPRQRPIPTESFFCNGIK